MKWISLPWFRIHQKQQKAVFCIVYWTCCLKRTCCLVNTEEKSKSFWSIHRSILLTRQFVAYIPLMSVKCAIQWYMTATIWEDIDKKIYFSKKKHGKYDDHTMIMPWITRTMPRNMAAMPSLWHDHDHVSPWSWYDHGNIMAWQPCFTNPSGLLRTCHKKFVKIGKGMCFKTFCIFRSSNNFFEQGTLAVLESTCTR